MWYTVRMKPRATNIADFETLRTRGQLYVDKTAYLHRLITDPSRSYFFWAVGLAFDAKTRQLVDADVEKIQ